MQNEKVCWLFQEYESEFTNSKHQNNLNFQRTQISFRFKKLKPVALLTGCVTLIRKLNKLANKFESMNKQIFPICLLYFYPTDWNDLFNENQSKKQNRERERNKKLKTFAMGKTRYFVDDFLIYVFLGVWWMLIDLNEKLILL